MNAGCFFILSVLFLPGPTVDVMFQVFRCYNRYCYIDIHILIFRFSIFKYILIHRRIETERKHSAISSITFGRRAGRQCGNPRRKVPFQPASRVEPSRSNPLDATQTKRRYDSSKSTPQANIQEVRSRFRSGQAANKGGTNPLENRFSVDKRKTRGDGEDDENDEQNPDRQRRSIGARI